MINELYRLTTALERAGIQIEHTHPKYKPIPKATKKAPCIHILLDGGHVHKLESISPRQAKQIRKYGSNQGTFPAMNLAPLYRLTDEDAKKKISRLIDGETTDFSIEEIRQLCTENNWGKKFQNKFKISMQDVPGEMTDLLRKGGAEFLPLRELVEETAVFADAAYLHKELEQAAFAMLERKQDISLPLKILFYPGDADRAAEADRGSLSVVLDSRKLQQQGMSAATERFTNALNQTLIQVDTAAGTAATEQELDAFGHPFEPLEEPMPMVKLAAGFDVSLRTMFRGQPCQHRYGRIENATYPISKEMRFKLQSALAWLSKEEYKSITWVSTDKNEVLFAYPETIPQNMFSLVNFCKKPSGEDAQVESIQNRMRFEDQAKRFISQIQKGKQPGSDPESQRIQYFVLRKVDKARTKVVYTYNTTPAEIERSCERWSLGCGNLPDFSFGKPAALFPLDAADVLNWIWRQDGKLSTDKFKPIPRYHGMQMLFEAEEAVMRRDLFLLMKNTANLAVYLGQTGLARKGYDKSKPQLLRQIWNTLALAGLLLHQLGIRKENYMQEFPYLFGQLLKVSDGLHEMYCRVVRGNDVPNTLAGSSVYAAGAEQPYKTLALLGQRMNPYITWAKSYRTKDIHSKGEESWLAGWYLSLYETIATQLYQAWSQQTRFDDEDKAKYFIGYLAKFPKKEDKNDGKTADGTIADTEDGKQEGHGND